MTMQNKFSEVFWDLPLNGEMLREFGAAVVRGVSVSRQNKNLQIKLSHNKIIYEQNLLRLKEVINRHYSVDVELEVEYSVDGDLARSIGGFWDSILFRVNQQSPLLHSILRRAQWTVNDSGLLIRVAFNGSFLFHARRVDKEIQELIKRRLNLDVPVYFQDEDKPAKASKGSRTREISQELLRLAEAANDSGEFEAAAKGTGSDLQGPLFPEAREDSSLQPSTQSSPQKNAGNSNFFQKKNKFEGRRRKSIRYNQQLKGMLTALNEEIIQDEEVFVEGEIFSVEKRSLRNDRLLVSFDITDKKSSITIKLFASHEDYEKIGQYIAVGKSISVFGKIQYDTYSRELNIMAQELGPSDAKASRKDNSETKRVELHLHTNMSSMDGMTPGAAFVKRALSWGHKAIAVTDHGVVQAFPEMMDAAKGKEIKIIYGVEAYLINDEELQKKKPRYYHATVFAKNAVGLRNLYELVSKAHLEYFHRRPRVPKSLLLQLREGLIVGTACEAGEFYKAVRDRKTDEELAQLAELYDYFEIQPVSNNMYLVRDGKHTLDEVMEFNKRIVDLGEKLNKPVIAAGDVHFLEPEDEVFRRIIMAGEGYKDADNQAPLFFRTTEEMLKEFEYLGEEKAYEVVVTNTNLIADMTENIRPLPSGTFPPMIEGAEDEVTRMTMERAYELYGNPLPQIVDDRIKRELDSIIKNGFAVMYLIAQKLVSKSMSDGYLVGSRGSVGSSLVATMCGITEVNPLIAHYLCPGCKHSEFVDTAEFAGVSGYDLPSKNCPSCQTPMSKDGHDIPFETFLGFDGDKEPDIDLNFSGEYQAQAHAYTEELLGKENVFKAGTIGTIAEKTAFGFVKQYMDERGQTYRGAELNRLKLGCTGIKRTTGQHPGGLVVVPNGHSINEFCPIQRPANDVNSTVITTHFDYHSLHGNLYKLDILGHDVPTIIRMLQDITGINPQTVPLDDPRVLRLFTSPEPMELTEEDILCNTGSLGLPEFGTNFVRQMLLDTQPTTFSELVRISGLSHGTDVWLNNAQDLIKEGTAKLVDIIPSRDDIMVFLISRGVEKKAAFQIMENVRKGKGLKDTEEKIMQESNIPQWYIDSCKKIKYLFPKGHAVAYVLMTVRIAYFKLYHPYSFYAATLSVKAEDFDYALMCRGKDVVVEAIKRINSYGKDASAKDKNTLTLLELVLELYMRGLKFAPINLYRSEAGKFVVTDDGLLPPLCSVQGLGASVAQNIVEARKQGEFVSIEDFGQRTKTNKTVLELLREINIFGDLPETSQISLF